MEPVPFRQFKIPRPTQNAFFTPDDSANQAFMLDDLARSGLAPDDMQCYTTPVIQKEGATAAYTIPYFGLDGLPLVDEEKFPSMFRTRFKLPQYSKEQRYTQPSGDQLLKQDLPSVVPYIHPQTMQMEGDYIVCCEGEKKTGAVIKYVGAPAFGIGGCQMWRLPGGGGVIHPWIREILKRKGINRVLIVPDGDVFRYDICAAYGTFAAALRNEGYDVEILNPGDKIDDLLVKWRGTDIPAAFQALPRINPDELVQSPNSLAKRYNLAFKQNDKGVITVHQNTGNVTKLLQEHPAFPRVWRNLDTNRVMVGDEQAVPDLTEMQFANYIQHNLGMEKVAPQLVLKCIQALAKENSKSPMLDYIKQKEWDGVARLDTWLQRHWGVEDSEYVREVASKWLISACARMDKPGTKVDWMFIVVGAQGTGKTSMPKLMFMDNARTLYGDLNDKDLHMMLHSALVIGFDELDSFSKRESSNLKAMITQNEDAFRPPYGASVELFPRRFTLYGCGNRHEFLQQDPSGYRRFAIVEVTRLLDFRGLEEERDQLWAEAWHRYQRGGVKFWEITQANAVAEDYTITDLNHEKITSFIERCRNDKQNIRVKDNILYFTMTELFQELGLERAGGNSTVVKEISAYLHKIGAVKPKKSIRHPITGVVGKFYELPLPPPI